LVELIVVERLQLNDMETALFMIFEFHKLVHYYYIDLMCYFNFDRMMKDNNYLADYFDCKMIIADFDWNHLM
jgi:hypothetical protein